MHSAGSPYTAGNSYDPNGLGLYTSELQTAPLTEGMAQLSNSPNIGYYSSTDPLPNQFRDGLGVGLTGSTLISTQSFIVSPTPGLDPTLSSPINVCYGGSTYGSLGIYVTGNNVVYVNGMTAYPGVPGTSR
jgi:hypothetical protein